jgi:serine/threonine protein kinase
MQATFTGTERYRVIRKLGEGGMGIVYEVQDNRRGERVALKTLRNPDPEKLYRLKREFRALANLNDPNLISLYELVVSDDVCFFTMELVNGVRIIHYIRGASSRFGNTGASSDDPRTTDSRGTTPSSSDSPVLFEPASDRQAVRPAVLAQAERSRDFSESRLRSALLQLARGLVRLHGTGRVHRDIKPSNIRVTEDGHLILLDFGLVAEVDDPQASLHGKAVGTGIYMAPEQGFGESPTPAADWYSVGIVLYEALTGRPPFRGSMTKIVLEKQQAPPLPPSELSDNIPTDLDQLCMELLAIRPEDRPSGDQVLQRLAMSQVPVPARTARKKTDQIIRTIPFTGRQQELSQLNRAVVSAVAGRAQTVLLSGSSGIGKTKLVRKLLDQERARRSDMVILQGRCYDSESVSFQAIDSLVDDLSRYWRRLPPHQAEELLPNDAALLTRLFPVLGRVPAVAGSPPVQAMADHQEMRTRAVAALQETLYKLARRSLLALFLDDMQWAGTNTLRLLADLMREPVPPSLLLILSTRPEGREGLLRVMAATEVLQLDALSQSDSQELARHLLTPELAGLAPRVAAEATGNPFFIIELCQHVQSGERDTLDSIRLEGLLSHKIQELDEAARRVLEIVALAGSHIKTRTLSRATGLAKTQLARELRELRAMKLLRISGTRSNDRVEPFHDRIREATLASLADSSRRDHHRALALALSGKGSEEQLSFHWRGAGEHERAAEHAQTAADEAMARLDFDRAANLYRMTLGLGDYDADQERAIMMTLGEALSNAGRPAEPAEVLTAAAEGAEPSLRVELQRRSVDELLRGGYVEEGLHASVELLEQIGLRFASKPWHALLSMVVRRIWLRLRGLRWHERTASEILPSTLNRIDACWSFSVGLAAVDTIRSADFQTRALLMALRAGEEFRICRSLIGESILLACQGSARAHLLLAHSRRISVQRGDPYLHAFQQLAQATATYYLDNDWRGSLNNTTKTEEMFRAHKGKGWEVDSAQLWTHFTRLYLGDLKGLSKSIASSIHEAEQRGDLYQAVSLRTRANLSWLIDDDAEEARRQLDIAVQSWMPVGQTYQLQHFFVLLAGCEIALYSGMSTEAEERMARAQRPLRRSLLFSVPMVLLEASFLEARIELAQGAAWPTSHLQPALRKLRRLIKKVRRIRVPLARALASLLEAGAAKLAGDSEDCETSLRQAVVLLEELDTMLHASAAKRRLGELIGGRQGAKLINEAETWMTDQGVKSPVRMTALLVPGWPYPG